MNGITLIIPTYNRAKYLRATLHSIAQVVIPNGMEVELLVIDNNCTDNTAQVVAEEKVSIPFPVRHLIETQQGLCFGRNRGMNEAQYKYLGYLDDDIELNPEWINGVQWAIENHGADVVIGPVTPLFDGEKPEYVKGRALVLINSGYSCKGNEPYLLESGQPIEIPGCNFLVRKQIALDAEGFDKKLDRIGNGLIAGGDTEFGIRLGSLGVKAVYHPDVSIGHIIVAEKLSLKYLRRRAWGLGATRYMLDSRHGTPRAWGWMQMVGTQSIRWVLSKLKGNNQLARDHEFYIIESLGYLSQCRLYSKTQAENPPNGSRA